MKHQQRHPSRFAVVIAPIVLIALALLAATGWLLARAAMRRTDVLPSATRPPSSRLPDSVRGMAVMGVPIRQNQRTWMGIPIRTSFPQQQQKGEQA